MKKAAKGGDKRGIVWGVSPHPVTCISEWRVEIRLFWLSASVCWILPSKIEAGKLSFSGLDFQPIQFNSSTDERRRGFGPVGDTEGARAFSKNKHLCIVGEERQGGFSYGWLAHEGRRGGLALLQDWPWDWFRRWTTSKIPGEVRAERWVKIQCLRHVNEWDEVQWPRRTFAFEPVWICCFTLGVLTHWWSS